MPFFVSSASLLIVVGLSAWSAMRSTDGHFIYALDDGYIHLALAKNLAEGFQLGFTPGDIAYSTSSPLWTALLVAARVVGVDSDLVPGAFALLGALLSLYFINRLLERLHLSTNARVVGCLGLTLVIPLAPLVLTGMEHTLHIALILGALLHFQRLLPSHQGEASRTAWITAGWFALAAATRLETLFLTLPASLVLLSRKKLRIAVLLVAASLLPVLIFGAASMSLGGQFLPTSVQLKGRRPPSLAPSALTKTYVIDGFLNLLDCAWLRSLTILILLPTLVNRNPSATYSQVTAVAACATLLHVTFAKTGWFYRYEAYLVALEGALGCAGLAALSRGRRHFHWSTHAIRDWACILLLAAVLGGPLARRAIRAHRDTPRAILEIYSQQAQTARLLSGQDFKGRCVAINDLGLVALRGSATCLDLTGLGSGTIAREILHGTYSTTSISKLLARHHIELVIVYPDWFGPGQPYPALPEGLIPLEEWVLVGTRQVVGASRIVFFATSSEAMPRLRKLLTAFRPTLPPSIEAKPLAAPLTSGH